MSINQISNVDYSAFYQEHISGLKQVSKDEWKSHCPFGESHSDGVDQNPSFLVNFKTGQYYCFACQAKGNLITFCTVKGIPIPGQKKKWAEPEAVFDYRDEHGTLLYQACRFPEKKFSQRRPSGDGNRPWIYQTKGIRKVPYRLPDLLKVVKADPDAWIWIPEGEKHCDRLYSLGLPATCNVSGAGKWTPELNQYLKDCKVGILPDNDPPGQKHGQKVAHNLHPVAKKVRVLNLPGLKPKGDIINWLDDGHTKEELFKLLEQTKDYQPPVAPEVKELSGISFVDPSGYTVTADQVEYTDYRGGIPISKILCPTGVIISSRAIDVDVDVEEIEVCFQRDNQWKYISVPRRILFDKNKILTLADRGFNASSQNASEMVKFLVEFESTNIDRIPRNYIVSGCGWKTVKEQKIFVLGEKILGLNKNHDDQKSINIVTKSSPGSGFEKFEKALHSAGSYSKWMEIIHTVLKYKTVSFAFYSSFAPAIIPILRASNFIVHIWGFTSTGKTTCLEICSSIFGNPVKETGGLIMNWSSTKVYIESISSYFNHCPIFLDDCQMAFDKDLEKILYMIANGQGKGRAKPDGVRPTMTWNTVCLSNGERPLTECTNYGGAKARTIEIYGGVFPGASGNFISNVKTEIKKNYGHAGQRFLKALLPLLEDKKEIENLEKRWWGYQQELVNEANCEIGDRLAWYFATVMVTAKLVNQLLDIENNIEAEENIARMFKHIMVNSEIHSDIATIAMDYIISWVRGNKNYFESENYDQSQPKGESFGIWKTGEFIAIRKHKLEKELTEKNFGPASIFKMWAEREWIKCESGHYTWVIHNPITQIKERLIYIPWEIQERF